MSVNATKPFPYMGSVSHATLRAEDLIPTFEETLKDLNPEALASIPKATDDESSEYLDDLFEALSNEAPPFFYFGSHVGDGSDFGFWLSNEALEEAERSSEVWRDPDNGTSMPEDASFRLVVSDHGNLTLYDPSGNEIWGIV